jgi:lipase
MQLRLLDVPVDGGELRVLQWGTGRRVAVAVHGITASAMSWQAVARQMPPGWTLAAPDLRGRGSSAHLPGPYGLERHAADVTAVLRHFGGRPVLAGHSMGAYVALLTRDAHPNLLRRLVLVDGGLPLPMPDGVDPEVALEAAIGPAIARLRQTFPSTEAYLDW